MIDEYILELQGNDTDNDNFSLEVQQEEVIFINDALRPPPNMGPNTVQMKIKKLIVHPPCYK